MELQPSRRRIILKFNASDIDRSMMFGKIYIPYSAQNLGEYQCEIGEVLSVGEDIDWVKSGDKVVVDYLVCYDTVTSAPVDHEKIYNWNTEIETIKRERRFAKKSDYKKIDDKIALIQTSIDSENNQRATIKKNGNYIDKDDYGNQYRWCENFQIYGILQEKNIVPVNNWVYIYEPEMIAQIKTESGIIIEEKKQDFETKAIRAKVKYISEKNSEEISVKEDDVIYIQPKMNFTFHIQGNNIHACPFDKILGYEVLN